MGKKMKEKEGKGRVWSDSPLRTPGRTAESGCWSGGLGDMAVLENGLNWLELALTGPIGKGAGGREKA